MVPFLPRINQHWYIIIIWSPEQTLGFILDEFWCTLYKFYINCPLWCAVLSHSVMSESATPWTAAHQAPLSMDFSRQEHWTGLPCPPPGDLPNLGTEPRSPTLQADSLLSEPPGKPKNTGVGSLSLLQGSSCPRNWTGVSCTAYRFFISWATRAVMMSSVISHGVFSLP